MGNVHISKCIGNAIGIIGIQQQNRCIKYAYKLSNISHLSKNRKRKYNNNEKAYS